MSVTSPFLVLTVNFFCICFVFLILSIIDSVSECGKWCSRDDFLNRFVRFSMLDACLIVCFCCEVLPCATTCAYVVIGCCGCVDCCVCVCTSLFCSNCSNSLLDKPIV